MIAEIVLRCVVQRSKEAEVIIDGLSQGRIEKGLVLLFGVGFEQNAPDFTELEIKNILKEYTAVCEKLADKILSLRIFPDADGKMNLSVKDIAGGLYLVSQFTLFADCRKGNRPGFTASAKPSLAKPMYDLFLEILRKKCAGLSVFSGVFGADMQVHLCNDGPVTIMLDAGLKGIEKFSTNPSEIELKKQNVDIDKSEDLRREFFANVSHELKTPISAIRGYAEIIQDMPAFANNETAQNFLSVIVRNAESLTNLIDEMLVVTGLESGALTLMISPYDIHAGLKHVVENTLPKAKQAEVVLLADVDPDIKYIMVDPQRFDSVLVNLVDNAVKYNRHGGTVKITVRQDEVHFIICIEDTGIGIPFDVRNRVFERFYRVDKSHSRLGGGSGLGLAIAKHVVQSHGGTISLRSEVGVGSSFTILLPKNPSHTKIDFLPFN